MSRFPKLTETFILYEILAMESLGVKVEVYPLLRTRQRVRHPEAEALLPRVRFHPFLSVPILQAQWHFFRRAPGRYLKLLWDVLRWTWGSANFFIGALGIFPKSVRFAYEMERAGVQHVHAHFCNHPAVAALIIQRLTGIPYSFTAHGTDLHVEQRMLDKKLAAAAFAVTVSEFNREVMVQAAGELLREKIHVIHCGVDPALFPAPAGRPARRPLEILCVATLEEVKGHRYLIEACRLLRERGVDFRCHLVGQGPWRRRVERNIRQAGLEDRVQLHGGQPRPAVLRRMAEADVFVLPSAPTRAGRQEGIPVSLMEAMASGLPVVATAITGIPELVENGRSGLLVPPGHPPALAGALEKLARDPGRRQQMGRAGRNVVLRDFNLSKSARRLLELFLAVQRGARPERPAAQPAAATPPRESADSQEASAGR